MLVLDCSVMMAWVVPDESSEDAKIVQEIMARHSISVIVPPLFFLEVINVLAVMQRRKRLNDDQANQALQLLHRLPITVDTEAMLLPAVLRVRELMGMHTLTAYDAAYLELARRRNIPLATLDKALRRAAEKECVFFAR